MPIADLNERHPAVADVKTYAAYLREIKKAYQESLPNMDQAILLTLIKAEYDSTSDTYLVDEQIPTEEGTEFLVQFNKTVGEVSGNLIKHSNDLTNRTDWELEGSPKEHEVAKDQPGVWGEANGASRYYCLSGTSYSHLHVKQRVDLSGAQSNVVFRLFVRDEDMTSGYGEMALWSSAVKLYIIPFDLKEPGFCTTRFWDYPDVTAVARRFNDEWKEIVFSIESTGLDYFDLSLRSGGRYDIGITVVYGNVEAYEDRSIEDVLGADPLYTPSDEVTTYAAWDKNPVLKFPNETTMDVVTTQRLNKDQVYRARVNAVGDAEIIHNAEPAHVRSAIASMSPHGDTEDAAYGNGSFGTYQVAPALQENGLVRPQNLSVLTPGIFTMLNVDRYRGYGEGYPNHWVSAASGYEFDAPEGVDRTALTFFVDDERNLYLTDYHDIGHN